MQATDGRRPPRPLQGMTLVEQVAVLAVASALACVAVPALHGLLARNRLVAAQHEYLAALALARHAAVMRQARTLFCPSRDGRQCADEERWDHGWLLAADRDHDNQPDGQPLHVNGNYAERLTIQSSVGRHHVRFQADGSARGSNLTFVFCRRGMPEQALNVVVANSGRIRGGHASAAQAAACAQQH